MVRAVLCVFSLSVRAPFYTGAAMLKTLFILASSAVGLASTSALQAQAVSPEVQALYAKAQAAQARDDTKSAIADYRAILKQAPDLGAAYNNLGRLLFNGGRYRECVEVLSKGLAVAPEMYSAQVMLGASYVALGEYGNALGPLQSGVRAIPEDRFARISLVRAEMGVSHPEEALADLTKLVTTDAKDQEAWYLLGKLHLQLSQRAFAEVQTLDPDTMLSHILEGEIMESMQNTPGAVTAYKQAMTKAGNDTGPLQHLADLYFNTGDWAQAREQYAALLAREPGNCAAHWKLAASLDELAEPPESGLKEIDMALGQCPSLAQAHAERARLLLRLDRPKEALPDLDAAQKAAPDEPSVQQLLARTYKVLGDPARSDAANQRYLELEQTMHQAKERHAGAVMQANP